MPGAGLRRPRGPGARAARSSSGSGSATASATARPSSRAASASAPPWSGPSSTARPCSLADEPTGSLDRRSAEALAELLVELNREEGTALVVATHAPALAARMGRALELREGRLAPPGAP